MAAAAGAIRCAYIALTQAAGFAAIEIEDQLLPRRVEHHIGIDNLVSTKLLVDKVREAIAARTDPDLVIIARTDSRRVHDLYEALRRCEAFHRAGVDMRDAEKMRIVGATCRSNSLVEGDDATTARRQPSARSGRCGNGDLFGLPRRTAIAPQLRANPRIGVGAEHLAWQDNCAIPVRHTRGAVLGVLLRAGLRDRRGCHESGKGDGGQYDLQVLFHDKPRSKFVIRCWLSSANSIMHKRVFDHALL
jgi:hypothetical protein